MRSLPSVVVVFVAAGVAALTAVTWMLPASDAAAAWPGANGRLSFFTIRDAKVQLRTGQCPHAAGCSTCRAFHSWG